MKKSKHSDIGYKQLVNTPSPGKSNESSEHSSQTDNNKKNIIKDLFGFKSKNENKYPTNNTHSNTAFECDSQAKKAVQHDEPLITL